MEQATLLKIAQFRTLAARKGKALDVVRFATDRAFAQQTLSHMLNDCDEELLVAGLGLMESMGFMKPPARTSNVSVLPTAQTPARAEVDRRYVGKLR